MEGERLHPAFVEWLSYTRQEVELEALRSAASQLAPAFTAEPWLEISSEDRRRAAEMVEVIWLVHASCGGCRAVFHRTARYLASRPHLIPLAKSVGPDVCETPDERENVFGMIARAELLLRRLRYPGGRRRGRADG